MLAQSPVPEAHDKELTIIQIEVKFGNVGFLRRRENRSTRRKTSRSKEENQQQTQPTYAAGSGIRTLDTLVGRALTTAPSLLPKSAASEEKPLETLALLREIEEKQHPLPENADDEGVTCGRCQWRHMKVLPTFFTSSVW